MERAIEELKNSLDSFICSDIYSTPCYRGQGADYLNAVAMFMTSDSLATLESKFKKMEIAAGRISDNRNVVGLDIDIVIYNGHILRMRDYDRMYFIKGYYQLTDPGKIEIGDYVYPLPDNRIALHPLAKRDDCRLLVREGNGTLHDTVFNRIGNYLPKDSLMVYNDTRVINARLLFVKPSGATIEIFCLEPVAPADYQMNFSSTKPVVWKCLVGNSKRWKDGDVILDLQIGNKTVRLIATRLENRGSDSIVRFQWDDQSTTFSEVMDKAGQIPIPPYLNRNTEASDSTDYQTVYNRIEGSVAAPTAGLHFTPDLLAELVSEGIEMRQVTLHVGAGTFQPVKSPTIADHPMHAELIDVPRSLIAELADTQQKVTAVGTTTVRTLESLYHIGCAIETGIWNGELDQWAPYLPDRKRLSVHDALTNIIKLLDREGVDRLIASTRIIIAPSYRYRIVDNLITNFHQPGSTLLLLVAAITGNSWQDVYHHALDNGYRFLSYGDACLFLNLKG